ncbi:MAG: hypothetical protein IKB97_05820 [Bacteroidaceae bacterium]|nr:hypothetical protein [Fibrobacter sp.]MBR2863058.1 hypothetical protein [Bacteroidaceae bacterium]MBR6317260.1 hypothetical protein [Fibrobacter sp.]
MMIRLDNDHDLDMALCAIKNYLLSRTDTIKIRKESKAALNKLSKLNDLINTERG